jgi:hypothetical protein
MDHAASWCVRIVGARRVNTHRNCRSLKRESGADNSALKDCVMDSLPSNQRAAYRQLFLALIETYVSGRFIADAGYRVRASRAF